MRPVGLLAGPSTILPQWLDVTTRGDASTIVFRPEGRVVWRVRWGAAGVVGKVTEVDGEPWTRSTFERDGRGALVRKVVQGPGAPDGPWEWRYRTDAEGRVVERTGTLALRMPWRSRNLPPGKAAERLSVRWSARGAVAVLAVDGADVRRDALDAAGRLLRTDFHAPARQGYPPLALVYRRDRRGNLSGIDRVRDGRTEPARVGTRDATVAGRHLAPLRHSVVERGEVELLLGAPVTTRDDGRGAARRVSEDWSPDCWLNEPSAAEFDPAGLLISTVQNCICGFCVDAALPVQARDIQGVDLHWTRGPWVRLDGHVDVTADHGVWTPRGVVAAGELVAGDEVLAADGLVRRLRTVERLPLGPERLGRNLRTRDWTFSAGGIRFASEQGRPGPCVAGAR